MNKPTTSPADLIELLIDQNYSVNITANQAGWVIRIRRHGRSFEGVGRSKQDALLDLSAQMQKAHS